MLPKHNYAKIHDLYLPLRDYQFDHGPSDQEVENKNFVGRTKVKERLKLFLDKNKSSSNHGAYLVTGYRGMGKTSLVREAIREINTNEAGELQERIKPFEFALSQDEVKDIDLLRQIAFQLDDYIESHILTKFKYQRWQWLRFNLWQLFLRIFLLISLVFLFGYTTGYAPVWPSDVDEIFSFLRYVTILIDNLFAGNSLGQPLLFFGLIALILFTTRNVGKYNKKGEEKYTYFPSKTHKSLKTRRGLDELRRELKNRLYAAVTQEDHPNASQIDLGKVNPATTIANSILDSSRELINRKNTLKYDVASPKEIEQYLQRILKKIDEVRKDNEENGKFKNNYLHAPIPPFVFVVDELDKIEPDYYFSPGDRESDKYIHHNDAPFHISTKARMRQEAISHLLANLKSFLNNVEAKFVFIGGRGMYDAALADIADRESFYSSIFNEVIYVESFFKDKLSMQAGLTQITEIYLCRLIMPILENGSEEKTNYSINKLIEEYELRYPDFKNNIEKKFKVIHALQNLIIFLTYRSNGSPKKLIELIERYIVNVPPTELDDINSRALIFKNIICSDQIPEAKQLYLKLSFKDQYEINLNSIFYRPYLIVNSKHLKALGDKLLYSTAFLTDHILKFHKSAFSWRNLEQIPDIILANKDPNFRYYYSDIMSFLLRQYLRTTVNAVFQYKFNSKIANEIKYLSKISEFSAAAFNFTLDESHHLKSYYKKKLAAKYKEYKEISEHQGKTTYVHSIGYLHSIIGDLHYYDEEYDDAIIHYTDSVQALRHEFAQNKKLLSHQFVLYTRNTLNLGLCLEKTRAYDKAYSIYRSLIIQLRSFQKWKKPDDKDRGGFEDAPKWEQPYKRMQLFLRPHIALFNVMEKQRQDGITYDNLERNIYEYLSYLGLDTEDTVNIFPLNQSNGQIDYNTIRARQSLIGSNQYNEGDDKEVDKKRLITLITDYYFSVGGILYYKNQIFYRLLYSENKNRKQDPISHQIRKNLANKKTRFYHPSHTAYLYYLHALINFNAPFHENIETLKSKNPQNAHLHRVRKKDRHLLSEQIKFITNYLDTSIYKILNINQYDVLANICGKLGDTILACLDQNDKKLNGCLEYIKLFESEALDPDKKSLILKIKDQLSLKLVFTLFRLSYHLYQRADKLYSSNFQYKKLLYVLKDSIERNQISIPEEVIHRIGSIPIKAQITISGVSNRAQLTKYRYHTKGEPEYSPLLYNNLSTSIEVKEIILLVESIKRKLIPDYQPQVKVNAYSTVSSMFARALELKFQADVEIDRLRKIKTDHQTFNHLYEELQRVDLKASNDKYEALFHPTVNGFFCLHELIRILNIYGNSYVLNHSFLAAAHRKLGIVSVYYQLMREAGRQNNQFNGHSTVEEELTKLLGSRFKHSTDPFYHFDLAKLHYQKAISLHIEGSTYKDLSQNMYSLDDDFNDNLTHFCAANERYRMNIGQIEKRIDDITEDLKHSELNHLKNYLHVNQG